MTGGTMNHDIIVVKVTSALLSQLADSNCRIFTSNMRVRVSPARYVYPDLSSVCGQAESGNGATTSLNPIFVLEMISPSSTERDRVSKLDLYSAAPSIEGYLILDQERVFAEWQTRAARGWHRQQFSDLEDEIALEPLGCSLALAQVYRGVSL